MISRTRAVRFCNGLDLYYLHIQKILCVCLCVCVCVCVCIGTYKIFTIYFDIDIFCVYVCVCVCVCVLHFGVLWKAVARSGGCGCSGGGSNGSADPTYCYSISGKHRPRRPIAYVAPDLHLLIRSMLCTRGWAPIATCSLTWGLRLSIGIPT